ncbi:MAG: hypothetical protein ACLPSF_09805, partial [Methylocella sp.]
MVNTKKTNSAAFGEILAGLGADGDHPAAGRGAPRGAAPRRDANTAARLGVAWRQSARARAWA